MHVRDVFLPKLLLPPCSALGFQRWMTLRFRGQHRRVRKRRWPLTWAGLKMDDDSGRRLRGMSGHVRTQAGDPEIRTVVNESAVFQTKRDVLHQSIVHASAIHKCRAGLALRP